MDWEPRRRDLFCRGQSPEASLSERFLLLAAPAERVSAVPLKEGPAEEEEVGGGSEGERRATFLTRITCFIIYNSLIYTLQRLHWLCHPRCKHGEYSLLIITQNIVCCCLNNHAKRMNVPTQTRLRVKLDATKRRKKKRKS